MNTPGAERPRVVVDTNVLVSAALTPRGNPAAVVQAVLDGRLVVVLTEAILFEYAEVLHRPRFGLSAHDVDDLLAFLETCGHFVRCVASVDPLPDESDRPFLDAAIAADALIVTGNMKHFPKSDRVVTPAELVAVHL